MSFSIFMTVTAQFLILNIIFTAESRHQFNCVFNSCIFFIPPYRFFTAFDVLSELREFADKELQEPNKKLAGGHKGTVYILGQ